MNALLAIVVVAIVLGVIVFIFGGDSDEDYDEPIIYEGVITNMYGQDSDTAFGLGVGAKGVVPTFTFISSDYNIVLDRTRTIDVSEETFVALAIGDRIRWTHISPHRSEYELLEEET